MQHADDLDTGRSPEGAVEKHVAIGDEGADLGAKFRPEAADGRGAREQARHVSQSRHDPARSPGIVLGDMVTDLLKVVVRLGSQNEAGHTLWLPIFVQQFGENPLAIEPFAAIELVDANGDVTTQSRQLLLLLLVEAGQGTHEIARIAERAL